MPGFEVFDEAEKKHINDVLESGIIMRYNFDAVRNNHWKAKELEKEIEKKFDISHAHLTSSGTTALITALKALGIGAGDEVIMPTFTFVASFEAILFAGAVPVLVDVDDTLTLSPEAVERAITPRTKVIMPVHMCGAMADMEALMEIARKHDLLILEDACQAIGGKYKGQYLGTLGDIGCFSFDFVKTVTCGEGGAIVTQDPKLYEISHQFSDHGHDHIGNDRGAEKHPITGLNFRISELHAAIGLAQWGKLDQIIGRQRELKGALKSKLAENPELTFRRLPDESGDNASFLSFFAEEALAKKIASALKEAGLPHAYWFDNRWHYVREWQHFKELKKDHSLPSEQREGMSDYANQDFSASDDVMRKTISIPISLQWDDERVNRYSEIIRSVIQEAKA